MPFEVKLKHAGLAFTEEPIRHGDVGLASVEGFVTSHDGWKLTRFLEGMGNVLFPLLPIPERIIPSSVDHLLAVLRRDKTGTVYLNEVIMQIEIQAKRYLEKGELATIDDIADVRRLMPHAGDQLICIPKDAGVMFFFSSGWCRGLYYDSRPLMPPDYVARECDIYSLFGRCYALLAFQERLGISPEEVDHLIDAGWFPFIVLKTKTIQEMVTAVREGWSVDDMLPRISEEVRGVLTATREEYTKHPCFAPHAETLETATERYLAGDYISAVSNLFPRIEGVLRTYFATSDPGRRPSHGDLVRRATTANPHVQHAHSLLVPRDFRKYLSKVFFPHFDPTAPEGATRHTVAHGVAPTSELNLKAATLGFLILKQLWYCLLSSDSGDAG